MYLHSYVPSNHSGSSSGIFVIRSTDFMGVVQTLVSLVHNLYLHCLFSMAKVMARALNTAAILLNSASKAVDISNRSIHIKAHLCTYRISWPLFTAS